LATFTIGEKASNKTLVKLTPRVNFTNVLKAAFARENHKSAKKTVILYCLFALFGFLQIKAMHKQVGKLTPCVNFTNTLAQSENVPLKEAMRKQFHQQSYTKPRTYFYAPN